MDWMTLDGKLDELKVMNDAVDARWMEWMTLVDDFGWMDE